MAKTIPRKAKSKAKAKVRLQPQRANMALDAPAKAYAQLLAHPCSAPLAHPVYAGSEGGILVRVESSFSLVGATSADFAAFVHWTPGAMGPNNIELLFQSGYGSTTALTATTRTDAPGKAFLTDNASTIRCVAGCMQVTYLGTELNRGGVVMLGRTQGGLIDSGSSYTPAGIEQALEHFERMPASTCELTWVPADMDQSFTDPNNDPVC